MCKGEDEATLLFRGAETDILIVCRSPNEPCPLTIYGRERVKYDPLLLAPPPLLPRSSLQPHFVCGGILESSSPDSYPLSLAELASSLFRLPLFMPSGPSLTLSVHATFTLSPLVPFQILSLFPLPYSPLPWLLWPYALLPPPLSFLGSPFLPPSLLLFCSFSSLLPSCVLSLPNMLSHTLYRLCSFKSSSLPLLNPPLLLHTFLFCSGILTSASDLSVGHSPSLLPVLANTLPRLKSLFRMQDISMVNAPLPRILQLVSLLSAFLGLLHSRCLGSTGCYLWILEFWCIWIRVQAVSESGSGSRLFLNPLLSNVADPTKVSDPVCS
jgi:hypothetical protein